MIWKGSIKLDFSFFLSFSRFYLCILPLIAPSFLYNGTLAWHLTVDISIVQNMMMHASNPIVYSRKTYLWHELHFRRSSKIEERKKMGTSMKHKNHLCYVYGCKNERKKGHHLIQLSWAFLSYSRCLHFESIAHRSRMHRITHKKRIPSLRSNK